MSTKWRQWTKGKSRQHKDFLLVSVTFLLVKHSLGCCKFLTSSQSTGKVETVFARFFQFLRRDGPHTLLFSLMPLLSSIPFYYSLSLCVILWVTFLESSSNSLILSLCPFKTVYLVNWDFSSPITILFQFRKSFSGLLIDSFIFYFLTFHFKVIF